MQNLVSTSHRKAASCLLAHTLLSFATRHRAAYQQQLREAESYQPPGPGSLGDQMVQVYEENVKISTTLEKCLAGPEAFGVGRGFSALLPLMWLDERGICPLTRPSSRIVNVGFSPPVVFRSLGHCTIFQTS